MKNEIKEILEFDFQSQGERIEINEYERDILKDYITNLQDKYERMKENAKIISNDYNNLEKRNEKALEINQKLQSMYILDSRAIFWLNQQEKALQGDDKE